jgi:hypothetical protein
VSLDGGAHAFLGAGAALEALLLLLLLGKGGGG